MTIDETRELFGYGSWATWRMFTSIEVLPPQQVESTTVSSYPSILSTLAHVIGVEWIWLRRWLGESPLSAPDWAINPAISELRIQLRDLEGERTSFLSPLNNGDLRRLVSYRVLDGQTFTHPLGHLIRHVVNHSTYHRGQLATLLRQVGQIPPNTDFTRYLREQK